MLVSEPIGLFYGSNTGQTEMVAAMIADAMYTNVGAIVKAHDVEFTPLETMLKYNYLILGTSTWHNGGPQASWAEKWDELCTMDFTGKNIACYGLGDSENYAEWYLDYMGDIYAQVQSQGANMAGQWPADGYYVMSEKALTDDKTYYLGLALDNVNFEDLTPIRVHEWAGELATRWFIKEVVYEEYEE